MKKESKLLAQMPDPCTVVSHDKCSYGTTAMQSFNRALLGSKGHVLGSKANLLGSKANEQARTYLVVCSY